MTRTDFLNLSRKERIEWLVKQPVEYETQIIELKPQLVPKINGWYLGACAGFNKLDTELKLKDWLAKNWISEHKLTQEEASRLIFRAGVDYLECAHVRMGQMLVKALREHYGHVPSDMTQKMFYTTNADEVFNEFYERFVYDVL